MARDASTRRTLASHEARARQRASATDHSTGVSGLTPGGRTLSDDAELAPCQRAMDSVRGITDAIRRRFDTHFDEALEERRDVVVERRRQPLGGERPGAEASSPPPRRPLPPRRLRLDLPGHGVAVRIERPVGGGRPRAATPAPFQNSGTRRRRR